MAEIIEIGLAPISLSVAAFVVAALILTVVGAETWSRRAARNRTAK